MDSIRQAFIDKSIPLIHLYHEKVPKYPPLHKQQFLKYRIYWPMIFHDLLK
jgi:hypothetical protein